MHWIMIVVIAQAVPVTATFDDEAACKAAAEKVLEAAGSSIKSQKAMQSSFSLCLPSSSE